MAKLVFAAAVLALLAAVSAAGALLGAPQDVDVHSQDAKDVLAFAIYELNKRSNDMYACRSQEVVRVRKQLANGYLYELYVKVGRTSCRKSTTNLNDCAFHTEPNLAETKLCNFKVYTQPWKSQMIMKDFQCS